jgi:hypothetical protein
MADWGLGLGGGAGRGGRGGFDNGGIKGIGEARGGSGAADIFTGIGHRIARGISHPAMEHVLQGASDDHRHHLEFRHGQ